MRPRHLIAAVACCSVLSTGIGFAAAQLSHPDPASARAGSSAVVSQLKKLHRDLATVHTDLNGISTDMGTVATQVTELDTHVGSSAYDSADGRRPELRVSVGWGAPLAPGRAPGRPRDEALFRQLRNHLASVATG